MDHQKSHTQLHIQHLRDQKYNKQLPRLKFHNGILVREIYEDTRPIKVKQICLLKHLRQEVVHRIHNSTTSGHIGTERTKMEFRNRFYFPGFTDFFVNLVKNCSTCLQRKRATNNQLRPQLQPLSMQTSFPGASFRST